MGGSVCEASSDTLCDLALDASVRCAPLSLGGPLGAHWQAGRVPGHPRDPLGVPPGSLVSTQAIPPIAAVITGHNNISSPDISSPFQW
jgi:hypothetical protein